MVDMSAAHHHQPWAEVALYEDLAAGESLAALLSDAGFESRTYDDKLFRHFLFLRPPRVTYRVQVRKTQLSAALRFLAGKNPPVLELALHCPGCGSLRVNYPQMTRQFILPTVLLHLGIIFRVIEHQCYCENCQEMWTLPQDNLVPPRVRDVKPFPF
jgi:hypothetical protein